jgi:hypothetical protein
VGFAAMLLVAAILLAVVVLIGAWAPVQVHEAPRIELRSIEEDDAVYVHNAEDNWTWDDFDVKLHYTGAFAFPGGEEATHAQHLVFVDIPREDPLEEGDRFHVCRADGEHPQVVTLRHRDSGNIVGVWYFAVVQSCEGWEVRETLS